MPEKTELQYATCSHIRADGRLCQASAPYETSVRDAKGAPRTILWQDAKGPGGTVIGVGQDMTSYHLLEQQLRQSQKMEAVGRLAGGIAHDFNNLLMIMRGYMELARDRVHEADPLHKQLESSMALAPAASRDPRHLHVRLHQRHPRRHRGKPGAAGKTLHQRRPRAKSPRSPRPPLNSPQWVAATRLRGEYLKLET